MTSRNGVRSGTATAAERRAERQRQVRLLSADDVGVRAIARRLGVAPSTVSRDLDALELRDPPPANAPPAPNGNGRALTHGLESPRTVATVIEPRAQELAPGIIKAHPHLEELKDGPAVFRYAMTLARIEHALGWLAEQADPMFSDRKTGAVHGLYGRLTTWEAAAARDEERLAISPRERRRLRLDVMGLVGAVANGHPDLSRLSDEELAEYERLATKVAAIDGEAVPA